MQDSVPADSLEKLVSLLEHMIKNCEDVFEVFIYVYVWRQECID